MRRFLAAVVVGTTFFLGNAVDAEMIEIHFTGLDLVYDGADIFDAGGSALGDKDAMTTITFVEDGSVVEIVTKDEGGIFADVLIPGVTGLPAGPSLIPSSGDPGYFNVSTASGYELALDIEDFSVFYTGFGITAGATGLATGISAESLPFSLPIDEGEMISIVFASTSLKVVESGGFVDSFAASGTGSISATIVPEPSTIVLLGMGAVMFGWFGWRRRS